jgi:hypothetical protein
MHASLAGAATRNVASAVAVVYLIVRIGGIAMARVVSRDPTQTRLVAARRPLGRGDA